MKTALVTGSNRGIGFEVAGQLLKLNYKVFITSRKIENGKKAVKILKEKFEHVDFLDLDVSDEKSIKTAAEKFKSFNAKLDVLINNAGILPNQKKIDSVDSESVMKTFITNSLGPLLVIQNFLQFMPNGGRIINVHSGLGLLGEMGDSTAAYSISKTALSAVTIQFSNNLSDKKISVNAVCPGWVRTVMGGKNAPRSVEKGAETIVWLANEATQNLTGKVFRDKKEIFW